MLSSSEQPDKDKAQTDRYPDSGCTENVLIADDNPDDRDVFLKIFKQAPDVTYRCCEATDIASVLEVVKTRQLHCVLLDYSLPGANGLEVLEKLRAVAPTLPVIMITVQGNAKVAAKAIKYGAKDYLIKSDISPNSLLKLVRVTISQAALEEKLNAKEAALKESEQRFSLAASGASVGIWDWINVNADEEWWSPTFYELLGYQHNEIPATLSNFKTLLHPDDWEKTFNAVTAHFDEKKKFRLEYRLRHKNDGYRWFLGSGQAVWDDHGAPRRMIGSIMEIDDLKSAQVTLEQRAARLELLNHELDRFAYIASHDLRAPLQGIANIAQWLEEDLEDHQNGDVRLNLQRLRNRAARMDRLLSDVLAYLRAGRRMSEPELLDCNELLSKVVHWVDAPNEFKIMAKTSLPTLTASEYLLEQTLINLISNAVKHHDQQQGWISLQCIERENEYEFIVEDDGPGIEGKFHDRVFEMFQTLKPRDDVEGSGLGLAIVKKMIESVGGRIGLRSPLNSGRGTAFCFTILKIDSNNMPRMGVQNETAKPANAISC
ncbi:MAG: PAS domain-containing protein [Pseudomonadota bacterium]